MRPRFAAGPRTAAEWFAARRQGTSRRRERQFADWLSRNPAHAEEYALCEITWQVSRDAAMLVQPAMHRAGPRPMRWMPAAAVLVGSLAAALVWFRPQSAQSWATGAGEQRTVVLSDGSRVTLNTRTRLDARISRNAREIDLENGEAFFEVVKDPSRPFTVRTRVGSARAVGTRFDVFVEGQSMAVATEEGRVRMQSPTGDTLLVEAGKQARVQAGQGPGQLRTEDMTSALDWLQRKLEVDDEPLGLVLEHLSRYTVLPLRADTDAIAALRVSAVLRTGDIDSLRVMLKGVFGLEIEQRGQEWVVIRAPDGRS